MIRFPAWVRVEPFPRVMNRRGEVVCPVDHSNLSSGRACPECKAVT